MRSSSRLRSGTSRDCPTSARLATSQKHGQICSFRVVRRRIQNSNSDSRLASIRGCSSFASEDVARRAGPVGTSTPALQSREVSFWYRFRRSVRPLRVVVPAPNRRPAEQKTRATDADAASQATVKRLSRESFSDAGQLVHPLTTMDELWLRDSRVARIFIPLISHQSRASSTGRSFGGNRPKRAVLFSSRRVASSFARPPSNRRLNPSRPLARARASPLPPPPRTASNAQK